MNRTSIREKGEIQSKKNYLPPPLSVWINFIVNTFSKTLNPDMTPIPRIIIKFASELIDMIEILRE